MTLENGLPSSLKLPKAAIPSTIAYYAAFVMLGLATSIIGPALPGLAEHTGTHIGEIGFLFTGSSLGYMLGSLSIGKIIDRTPGHKPLALILFVMASILALTPLIRQLWLLTAILILLGISEGGLDVSGNLLLVWIHRDRANPFLNGLHFFFGVGAFLAPVLIAHSRLATSDIHAAFWILALYPLPISAWLLRLPSPISPKSGGELESRPVRWMLVALIAVVFTFYVGAEIGFGGWIYTYATSMNLASASGAAYLTSIFWGALTAGRLLGIGLAHRFRPIVILLSDLTGCIAGLVLIWLFPNNPQIVWIGTIALGLCMASIFPTLLAFAEHYLTMSGQVTRWFFVATGAGGMFLPWYLGVLIEMHGPKSIMPALCIDMGLALLAFLGCMVLIKRMR